MNAREPRRGLLIFGMCKSILFAVGYSQCDTFCKIIPRIV
jgi:hypothetical protein